MRRTAIICLADATRAVGFRALLQENFDVDVRCVDAVAQISPTMGENVDCFIVDSDNFVANMRFFLPRQSRTLIVTGTPVPHTDGDAKTVAITDNTERIIEVLAKFFETEGNKPPQSGTLSQREADVLQLIASGCINKEIADRLGISFNTVLTHRKNITAKLGIKSVSGLTFYAMMNGLVAPK